MSLYPSLEDMKVDQMGRAQAQMVSEMMSAQVENNPTAPPAIAGYAAPPYPLHPPEAAKQQNSLAHLYPSLGDYMGLEFTDEVIAANMPEYLAVAQVQPGTVAVAPASGPAAVVPSGMVAPISGASPGLYRAQVTNSIREITLCKDSEGKVGMRVKAINKGVFVCLVKKNSPAALAGLRFGDQILQINSENVAGYSMEKVHDMLKKSPTNGISLAIRDRPFERTVTLHKDSTGHIGFQFRDGEITALVKDSSAARNGLLTDHHLLEVNGQNVVGLKDKEVSAIINECGPGWSMEKVHDMLKKSPTNGISLAIRDRVDYKLLRLQVKFTRLNCIYPIIEGVKIHTFSVASSIMVLSLNYLYTVSSLHNGSPSAFVHADMYSSRGIYNVGEKKRLISQTRRNELDILTE
ncbi:syntenin-1-like [Penaeus indicus]|uniref:syntenin-1-like n=1 Tax=Penaeus indicus TaxID=29960 RepID=UPI00300D3E93